MMQRASYVNVNRMGDTSVGSITPTAWIMTNKYQIVITIVLARNS